MQNNMNEVLTLHNIYRRLVLKEAEMDGRLNTCTSCNEKYILTQSRIAVDNDHWSSSAYSTYCTQCVADHLGWQAEKQFMNARWDKNDRVLLTRKGAEALASAPD